MRKTGNPVSQGIALGRAYCYQAFIPRVEEHGLEGMSPQEAVARYEALRESAKMELEAIVTRLQAAGEADKAKIFSAHLDILFDEAMDEEVHSRIEEEDAAPDWAISQVFDQFITLLGKAKDPLIRERTEDLRDVKHRLLRLSAGVPERNLSALEGPVVVVCHDLLPSDTATLDRAHVLAIVTEIGGPTSHSAILARSYELPAILGVEGAMADLSQGQELIVDAVEGILIADPTAEEKAGYEEKRTAFAQRRALEKTYLTAPTRLSDGTKVHVELNVGAAGENELAGEAYTDGVGLFRTEFLYLGRESLPTEEEQYEIYKKVLLRFAGKPVTLRTLDVGGDKKLSCLDLPKEENPFLGNRALRLCFQRPDLFKTQLRAALRAAACGELWLMFPMVGSLDDLRGAKALLAETRGELDAEGVPHGEGKIGIMVEIPSIALIADLAAKEADFASIGTNDLIQYTTASDRMNPAVAPYYQSFHPGVFRLIGQVAEAFQAQGKSVAVCGEMGGDPLTAAVLVGLGVDRLSMGLASVARIKKLLSGLDLTTARVLAETVRNMETAAQAETYLKTELAPLL